MEEELYSKDERVIVANQGVVDTRSWRPRVYGKVYESVIDEARKIVESTELPYGLTIIRIERENPSKCVLPDLYF